MQSEFTATTISKVGLMRRCGLPEYVNSISGGPKAITLLVQRHYVAHPRSDGVVDRTLHQLNETELALHQQYPNDAVQVVSFETMSINEQLAIIVTTYALLSVHGAGNIHSIFMRPGSVFVEFFPPGFASRKSAGIC
jgi:hypothetical protein